MSPVVPGCCSLTISVVVLPRSLAWISRRKWHGSLRKKWMTPRVEVICGDIETIPVRRRCDCCVVYNAFPHFEDPLRLVARLVRWLKPGGRLTVAHGMSLEALQRHHTGGAAHVSRAMLSVEELAAVLAPWFCGGYEDRGPGEIYCVGNM